MDTNPTEPTETEPTVLQDVVSLVGTVATVLIGRVIVLKAYRGIGKRAIRKAEKAQKIEANKSK